MKTLRVTFTKPTWNGFTMDYETSECELIFKRADLAEIKDITGLDDPVQAVEQYVRSMNGSNIETQWI